MINFSDKCELNNVCFREDAWCEHCDNLEPHTATWSDGHTWWCLNCTSVNLKDDIEKIRSIEKENKISYYQKKLSELMK